LAEAQSLRDGWTLVGALLLRGDAASHVSKIKCLRRMTGPRRNHCGMAKR